ncbi:MAG: collagen-like protein [Solirubrobacterales bacterium]|nr:collagen-like protein [Solirubrobacterales bacterium]
MFSAVRNRVTYANVAATLALVFAMSGGALAAKRYLITSARQISPKVLKELKGTDGKPGANGAQGLAGPTGPPGAEGKRGAQGAPGEAGREGKPGTNGTSVTSASFKGAKTVGSEKCEEGGAEVSSASGHTLVCNGSEGAPGSPWTAGGVLPKGATETGSWATVVDAHFQYAPISFSIPIKVEGEERGEKMGLTEKQVHIIHLGEGEKESSHPAPSIEKGECKGTDDDPGAAEGNLCVFTEQAEAGEPFSGGPHVPYVVTPRGRTSGAGVTGALVAVWEFTEPFPAAPEYGTVYGTWAVTGTG